MHFSHIYTNTEEETNTLGNNILRPKDKSHKSYEYTIYDTQGTHTLFARSSAHHHLFWPTTERTEKTASSNKKSQNTESNCLYTVQHHKNNDYCEHKMHEWLERESTCEDRLCECVKTRKGKKTLVCLIKSS